MSPPVPPALPDDFLKAGLHEVYASTHADAACLSGCALMLGRKGAEQTRLWVRHAEQDREAGAPHPAGLIELGISPASIIVVRSRDPVSALQAALEGARCTALGLVIVELWGEAKAYDLTASRRLSLAARASGRVVLIARVAASPTPSAAETRWRLRAVPSRALAANAPGLPAFEMALLRARSGQEGLRYCVEWDRDARQFIPRLLSAPADAVARPAPLSGAVVSIPVDRPGAPGPWRRAG